MRKAKIYRFISNILLVGFMFLLGVGLGLVGRFWLVDLFSSGSKLQSIGQIGLVAFGLWWLLGAIDGLDKAEDKALDAEYKQIIYSGLMARGEDEQNDN